MCRVDTSCKNVTEYEQWNVRITECFSDATINVSERRVRLYLIRGNEIGIRWFVHCRQNVLLQKGEHSNLPLSLSLITDIFTSVPE